MRWSDLRLLQRAAARHTEPWVTRGGMVYTQKDELVAEFRNPELASLSAAQHNNFISIVNKLYRIALKNRDRAAMTKLEEEDE